MKLDRGKQQRPALYNQSASQRRPWPVEAGGLDDVEIDNVPPTPFCPEKVLKADRLFETFLRLQSWSDPPAEKGAEEIHF